jgi:hypothetical protein
MVDIAGKAGDRIAKVPVRLNDALIHSLIHDSYGSRLKLINGQN